jgi:hypothetical protein
MEERKGFLTPEQEVILDGLIKFKSSLAEKVDGIAIKLLDNQGLERVKQSIAEKNPDAIPVIYEVVDMIFAGLAEIVKED